ncbi:MAG: hypothetical protein M1818_000832 [Claussenomyces sp. TS43310]|nr:MAG: hypothetical protein M1818_000832 [Claussenomyces sp. TS43310]
MAEEKVRTSGDNTRSPTASAPILPTVNPEAEKPPPAKPALHAAVYVIIWISLSSSIILFNKWILDTLHFRYPVLLTTWHLTFATIMTQILARTTKLLDARKTMKMTGRVYLRAIMPIGLFFSLSLICGNLTYLYLSVAFIQMLKATTPVAVLLAGWAMGVERPNLKVLINVSFIVVGVILASIGEIKFVLIGFLFQLGGIIFEAVRLVMVQRLLNGAEYKMDPLVSLYYFAPVCALMNGFVALVWEVPRVTVSEFQAVGFPIFFANALIAFLLNVSVVFLIGKTSSLVLTLCGVLKDILLVGASMLIWGTEVSALQFFGYSIALGGLVYYKLGGDQLKARFDGVGRAWAEYGMRHPIARKAAVLFGIFLVMAFLLGAVVPTYAPAYDLFKMLTYTKEYMNSGV